MYAALSIALIFLGIIIILLVSSGDMSGRGICLDEFGALKLCNIDIFHHKGTSTNFAQVHRPSWSYSRLLLFKYVTALLEYLECTCTYTL